MRFINPYNLTDLSKGGCRNPTTKQISEIIKKELEKGDIRPLILPDKFIEMILQIKKEYSEKVFEQKLGYYH